MTHRTVLMRIIAVLLALLAISSICMSQELQPVTKMELVAPENQTGFASGNAKNVWRNSPVAEHHKAAVRVQCDQTPYAGSGVVIKTTGNGFFVLTNHHVIQGTRTATVHSIDGGSTRTTVVFSDPKADLAVLYEAGRVFKYGLPVFDGEVPIGADVELLGFGGPESTLRHVLGRRVTHNYNYPLSIDTYTVSGDSGGAMVFRGGVAGINFGGPADKNWGSVATRNGNWNLTRPASSQCDGRFLRRVLTQICGRYGCSPVCVSPTTPQTPPPVSNPTPLIGPPGKDGKDGKDGISGIQKLRISQSGNLIAIYANGREEIVGNVSPPQISYYEIVKRGNTNAK
jgi:hypothetical protein